MSNPDLRPDKRDLRYAVLAAVNGHPVTPDEGWEIIKRWDALATEVPERVDAALAVPSVDADAEEQTDG